MRKIIQVVGNSYLVESSTRIPWAFWLLIACASTLVFGSPLLSILQGENLQLAQWPAPITSLAPAQSDEWPAPPGYPDSAEFGFGAWLNIDQDQPQMAINLATGMELDWIAVELDWTKTWPDRQQPADFGLLPGLLQSARSYNLQVLVSIKNAPAWGMTPTGPSGKYTALLILQLLQSCPRCIQAVELFPGMNTLSGWGAAPDPQAGAHLINDIKQALAAHPERVLILPGIEGNAISDPAGGMLGADYLKALVAASNPFDLPIIGVSFKSITGSPIDGPGILPSDYSVLREYETLYNLLGPGQKIWVTRFCWPAALSDPAEQAAWTYQAFRLMQAQLYLGAAFFNSLNTPDCPPTGLPTTQAASDISPCASLLLSGNKLHPAVHQIIQAHALSISTFSFQGQDQP